MTDSYSSILGASYVAGIHQIVLSVLKTGLRDSVCAQSQWRQRCAAQCSSGRARCGSPHGREALQARVGLDESSREWRVSH